MCVGLNITGFGIVRVPTMKWKCNYFMDQKDRSAVVQIKVNISVILDICEVEMEQSIPIIISLDVQTEEE